MKTMKRTLLVGASMFALTFGLSAQVDNNQNFEAYQVSWKLSHAVTQMTPTLYEQMKTDWVQSLSLEPARVSEEISVAEKMEMKAVAKRQAQGLPAGFPLKANTGNAAADEATHKAEKNLWIQNNPALYKQMKSSSETTSSEREAIRNQERNNQIK